MGTSDPVKVIHLAPTGNWAGTEEMVCRMANELSESHDVGVVMTEGENVDEQMIRSRFDPTVRVLIPQVDTTPGERAAQIVEEFGVPDLIHAHLRPGVEQAWPLRDLAPVIGHLHVRYFSSQFWWVDAVICVSDWQSHDVPANFTGPVFMIPNSIEEFESASSTELREFRRRIDANPQSVIFGAVGRLSTEKGFDTLVRAFRSALGEHDRLVIAGDGSTREALDELSTVDRRIHLLGYVPRARRLLSGLDVYVSSSRLDSFGLSVLEAMSIGLRIVSTDARGPNDLLSMQPAVIVPTDDEPALAAAMEEAARQVLAGDAAPIYDLAAYNHRTCAQNLAGAYDFLLDGGVAPTCLVRDRSS